MTRCLHLLPCVLAVFAPVRGTNADDVRPPGAVSTSGSGDVAGGTVVHLRRNAPVRGEVSIVDRRPSVEFEPVDGMPVSSSAVRDVRIELKVDGTTRTLELTEEADGTRFGHADELPRSIRTTADLVGTLIVRVGDVEYRGPLAEPSRAGVAPRPPAPPDGVWNRAIAVLVVYCLLIVAASLVGGWLPTRVDLTHDRMQIAMSLVGGLMLGIGLFHMLPHGVHELGSVDLGVWWMMIGLVSMFLLIRTFHFHQHGPVAQPVEGPITVEPPIAVSPAPHDHDHDHSHDHPHAHSHGHSHESAHELSWLGVFVGLSLHTLIDGIALAASVRADVRSGHTGILLGVGTFLAILLHKPLDAVSITTLMSAGGWSPSSRNLANLAYASMCPLGALAFAIGLGQFGGGAGHLVVGAALSFSAGVFVCISLGDILPEMEFHDHNRVTLTLVLLAGIALAWAIGFLEPAHAHQPL